MAKKIKGIVVELGGDTSGLTKALSDADRALAATQRELNEVQKGLKLDPSNTVLLAQKQELLTQAIADTSAKLKALEDNAEKAKRAMEANAEWERQYKPLKEQIDAASKSLRELKDKQAEAKKAFEVGNLSAEDYARIKAETKDAEKALAELKEQKKQLDAQFADGHISPEEYREYQREVENTRSRLQGLQSELHNTGTSAEQAHKQISDFGTHAKETFTGVVKAAAAVAAAIIAVAKKASDTGAEFDKSMSGVAATMGYSVDEINTEGSEANKTFEKLRETAQAFGKSTEKSATEASSALNSMAQAGYKSEAAIAMLPSVLDLSSAGELELADSSKIVTKSQKALGLSMEETTQLIDQMARTASETNTDVSELGAGILKIGATARSIRGGTRELVENLGVLADNGYAGAEGGTHLRNVILSLQSAAKDGAVEINGVKVAIYDANGEMREMSDIYLDLNAAMDGLTTAEKDAEKSVIFNKTDLAAVNALLGTNVERWDELKGKIEDSSGAAHEMAETKLDNLAGDITLFKSAVEGAEIAVSDKLSPTLRETVQFGTEAVGKLTEGFGQGGLSGAVAAAHKIISEDLSEQAELIFGVEAAVDGVIGAFVTYKAAMLLSEGITALKTVNTLLAEGKTLTEALNAAQMANPYVLVATLAVGAAVAIKKLIDIQTDLIEETADSYDLLDEKQKEAVDNARELSKTIGESRDAWNKEREGVEKQADSYRALTEELYKLDSQQQISAKDRAIMKTISDKLNSSIKGLNIELDEQTGHLKTQRETINELIDGYERQAKAAAAQERLTELFKEQYEAEKRLKDVTAQREEAYKALAPLTEDLAEKQKALDEFTASHNSLQIWGAETEEQYRALTQAVDDATAAVNDQKDRIGALNGTFVDTSTSLHHVQDDIEGTKDIIGEMGSTMDGAAETFEEDADKISGSAKQMGQSIAESFDIEEEVNSAVSKIEEIIKAYDDKLAARTGTLQNWFEVNATVEGEDASFNSLSKALDKQISDMEKWTKDIDRLEKEGINQNFLDRLKDAGPASQALATELLKVPEKQRNEYANKWFEAYQSAATVAEQQLSAMKAENERQIESMISDLKDKSPDFAAAWKSLGGDAIDGYIEGLRDGKKLEELKAAVKEMVDAALEEVAEEQDSHSPAKKTMKEGGDFSEGYAVGMTDKLSDVVKAARNVVSKALGTAESMSTDAKKAADVKLPTMKAISTASSSTAPAAVQINAEDIAAATKKAFSELFSDNRSGVVYMDGREVGTIVYPTINEALGGELTLITKGCTT